MTIDDARLASGNLGARSAGSAAWADLIGGLRKPELWGRLGWLEVKRRYRRTTLGPFWSSITLAIYTLAVGLVGAGLFRQNIHDYLPYLTAGMIVWTLFSTIVLESCLLFVAGHALLRNVSFEYSTLAYALVYRNFMMFLHNLVLFSLVVLALKPQLINPVMLLAVPGLALLLLNGVWLALLVGMICLRYRDVQPLVQTAIQILMLVTPIFWTADALSGTARFAFVQLNPVYRLIELVRAPLLGEAPTLANFGAVLIVTVVGWSLTYAMFRSFRKRIAYWS